MNPASVRQGVLPALLVVIASQYPGPAHSIPVSTRSKAGINTLREIGPAIMSCWHPPGDVGDFELRLRLSFRRDGSVLGQPKIVFTRFTGDLPQQQAIVRAVLNALADCTPLPLTSSLGGAIAGRVFTLRFGPPTLRA